MALGRLWPAKRHTGTRISGGKTALVSDIFRDQTSLAANPDLYATIERELRDSRHFVLLASPGAAQSPWVGRETRSPSCP